MILEAVCRKCGETFNPTGEEDGFADNTPEHYTTADGEECGGTGDITGSWGAPIAYCEGCEREGLELNTKGYCPDCRAAAARSGHASLVESE